MNPISFPLGEIILIEAQAHITYKDFLYRYRFYAWLNTEKLCCRSFFKMDSEIVFNKNGMNFEKIFTENNFENKAEYALTKRPPCITLMNYVRWNGTLVFK